MSCRQTSYLSPKIEAQAHPEKGGWGIYAREPIQEGELLVVWGGDVITGDKLPDLAPVDRQHTLQVEEDIYLAPSRSPEPGDYINHSCEPNAVLSGQIVLIARRPIAPDEEICYDYAMSDGSPYDEFECACGQPSCRQRITGNDWANPELWERYAGHFSPYLQRRIDKLRRQTNSSDQPELEKLY